ncbi:MAG: hypothetical protein SVW02_00340 [Candidatus Nanohaloarchaea archaeon]|nr:hypothetical protein [Candidatus Nanohaloarchaea archaeon]
MGLFDRIRGSEDEVEIRPQDGARSYDTGTEEQAESADDGDEFILPGMNAAEDTTDTGASRSASRQDRGQDGVDRLIEQNERIIELLEQLTGTDDRTDDDADVASVL